MLKGLVRVGVLFAAYLVLIYTFKLLFRFLLIESDILTIDISYLGLIDTTMYLILLSIVFLYFFCKKRAVIENKCQCFKKASFDVNVFFIVVMLAIFFRVIEDPILRINTIGREGGLNNLGEISDLFYQSQTERLILFLNIIVLAPIFEELLYRQIMLGSFASSYKISGTILTSLFFAFAHIQVWGSGNNVFIASFLFSIISSFIFLTSALIYCILYHIVYNIVWYLLLIYNDSYRSLLSYLDFDFRYWIIVIGGMVLFAFLLYKLYKTTSDDGSS